MSPLLRRASEQSQSDWREIPEGVYRFRLGVPTLKEDERFGMRVVFPLQVSLADQSRILEDLGPTQLGQQQSFRTTYRVGLSLGYIGKKDNQYHSTKLVDMLAAVLGSTNVKKFREWIAQGGGPPRPADLDDAKAELELIGEWLRWWEDLEVYGTVTHRDRADGGVWTDFAGPIAVGAMPGQRDDEYQALGRGKLRALIAESGETRESRAREARANGETPPAQRFTAEGEEVHGDGSRELPF